MFIGELSRLALAIRIYTNAIHSHTTPSVRLAITVSSARTHVNTAPSSLLVTLVKVKEVNVNVCASTFTRPIMPLTRTEMLEPPVGPVQLPIKSSPSLTGFATGVSNP